MKTFFLSMILGLAILGTTQAQTYTEIITDATGDGVNATWLDGTNLAVHYSPTGDSLWFRIGVTNLMSNSFAIGVNLMINIPNGGQTFNFWGNDNKDPYHKLVTFWVTGSAPSTYAGTIGVSDAAGVSQSDYQSLSVNNLSPRIMTNENFIYLGMKRTDLITDSEMGGNKVTLKLAAAVGSNMGWNDDLYDPSKNWELDLNAGPNSIDPFVVKGSKARIYPNPVSDNLTITLDGINSEAEAILRSPAGRKVRESLIGTEEKWDLSDFPAGIYFLEIHQANQPVEVHKIWVE